MSTGCSLPSHPQAQEKQVARNCYVTIQHCNIKRQGQTSSSSANRHYNVPKIGSSPSILVITCYTHDIIRPKTRNSNTHLPSSSCILPLHQQKNHKSPIHTHHPNPTNHTPPLTQQQWVPTPQSTAAATTAPENPAPSPPQTSISVPPSPSLIPIIPIPQPHPPH